MGVINVFLTQILGGMVTTRAMGEAISPLKERFGCLTAVQLSNQIARNELSAILERLTGCAQGKINK